MTNTYTEALQWPGGRYADWSIETTGGLSLEIGTLGGGRAAAIDLSYIELQELVTALQTSLDAR